jgi:hypothetical protein
MTNDIRYFVGMDIGDSESVVAICSSDGYAEPTVIESARMPTLIAQRDRKAKPEIGYDALRVRDPVELDVSFKCDPAAERAQWRLSAGLVLVFIEGLFADSPYLSTAVVVRESRGALLQAWEFENLPAATLAAGILVIDIGSSTIDCTVVRDGTASEHPASNVQFGLRALDERIFQDYLDRHPDAATRHQQYKDDAVAQGFMLYMCRLHKERAFGAKPDLPYIPDDWTWVPPEWDRLNVVDVPALLDEPDGWLSHYRTILTQLAHDPALATTTILLTGGGAHIPQIVETTRRTLSGHTIQITTDPMTGVAKGLAVHGWLDHAVPQFEAEAKKQLGSESTMMKVRTLYPEFLKKSVPHLLKSVLYNSLIGRFTLAMLWFTETLQQPDGEFHPEVKVAFEHTLRDPRTTELSERFSKSITTQLEPDFNSLARQHSIRPGRWRPQTRLDPSKLRASQGSELMGKNSSNRGVVDLFIWLVLLMMLNSLSGDLGEGFAAKLLRTRIERMTPMMTTEASSLIDKMVRQAIEGAVKDSLDSVRLLLLDSTRQLSQHRELRD